MRSCFLSFIIFLSFACSKAQTQEFQLDSTTISLSVVAENLDVPWELVWGPDDHIWFTERNGTIKRLNPNTGDVSTLITVNAVREISEAGLLGLALDPNFENNPFVYAVYTYAKNGLTERLVRFTYNGTTLVNEEVLLDDIPANNNHSGSRILFLADNTLLMTTGDALNVSNSQDPNSLAGKVLRINRDGSIPADNPNPDSYVWSLGHRNAQGLVLGQNGTIYSSEHGPSTDDELNILEAGRNFGWPEVNGYCDTSEASFCDANNVKEPIMAWTPTLAVAGIDYYNSNSIPEWKNAILMTTLKEDDFRVLKLNAAGTEIVEERVFFNNLYGRLRDICIAPNGDIYFSTSNRDGRAGGGFPVAEDDRILRISNENRTGILQPENSKKGDFKVFPNPAEDRIQTNLAQVQHMVVLDGRGRKVATSSNAAIDISTLSQGPYTLRVKSESGIYHSSFVKTVR